MSLQRRVMGLAILIYSRSETTSYTTLGLCHISLNNTQCCPGCAHSPTQLRRIWPRCYRYACLQVWPCAGCGPCLRCLPQIWISICDHGGSSAAWHRMSFRCGSPASHAHVCMRSCRQSGMCIHLGMGMMSCRHLGMCILQACA